MTHNIPGKAQFAIPQVGRDKIQIELSFPNPIPLPQDSEEITDLTLSFSPSELRTIADGFQDAWRQWDQLYG